MKYLICGILFLVLTWNSTAAMAGDAPTCAILVEAQPGIKDRILVPLIMDRLSAAGVTVVERENFAEVLKEQQLKALEEPAALDARRNAGKLLNADFLVLVRSDPGKATVGKLVVCECSSGIRLAVHDFPLDRDPSFVSGAIGEMAGDVIRHARQGTHMLCATPPFVSKDLSFEFDTMKAGCAAAVESALSRRIGVYALELGEVQALERELVLKDTTQPALNRPLPLYFLGDYRNDGVGAQRRVSISLVLKQGLVERAHESRKDIKPDQLDLAIDEMISALLDSHAVQPAGGEIDQLLKRAADFEKTGSWMEAADLYEQCLLLDPSHRQARLKVINALGRMPPPNEVGLTRDHARALLVSAYERRLRRLHHQEIYARQFFIVPGDYFLLNFDLQDAEARRVEISLIHDRLRGGAKDGLIDLLSGPIVLQLGRENSAYGISVLKGLVEGFVGFPKARKWTVVYSRKMAPHDYLDGDAKLYKGADPEWDNYLTWLDHSKSEDLRLAADDLRTMQAETWAKNSATAAETRKRRAALAAAATRPATTTGPVAELLPVQVKFVFPPGKEVVNPTHGRGWIAAEKGMDILWGYHDLYLMTDPGVARCVWSSPRDQREAHHIDAVCFDGHYVWAAVEADQRGGAPVDDPRLIVLDPHSGNIWTITATDGLLPMGAGVAIAPVEPGRICVVAGFRPPKVIGLAVRGWCGNVTFDPKAGAKIKVFHEAAGIIHDDWKEKFAPADIGFLPTSIACVGTGADRRLIVRRQIDANSYRCFTPPLVIDPDKCTVELWSQNEKLPGKANGPWSRVSSEVDGTLYFAEPSFVEGDMPKNGWKPRLFRATGSHAHVEQIGQLPFIDYDADDTITAQACFGGKIYLVDKRLFVADPATGKVQVMAIAFPDGSTRCTTLAVSSHFGLLLWPSRERGPGDKSENPCRFDLNGRP